MLTATLSKAGWGLMALVAVGGIESLPALANWGGSPPSTVHLAATEPGDVFYAKRVEPALIDTAVSFSEKPVGVIGRLFAKSFCDHDASPADRIVSGDRITLRVFAEAANSAERFERRDLSGNFTVDAAGKIAMPAIGRLPIAGQALTCLENAVEAALKAELDITATVTVAFEARPPVLLEGTVIAPGSYEFTPNLTLNALLAKAGAGGSTADTALYRSLEARRQELRSLRAGLMIRHARLTAQRAEAQDLQLPSDLVEALRSQLGGDRVDGEKAVLRAALDEIALRKMRDAAIRTDLESTLEMVKTRRNLVRARFENLSRRRDELDLALTADCRGRCGSSRRYDELRFDNLNGRLGDLDLTVEDAERRVVEARHAIDRHDRDVAFSYAQADSKLALAVAETLAELNALDAEIHSVSAQIMDLGSTTERSVRVERRRDGKIRTFNADRNFPLFPGDIVIVGPPDNAMLASVKGQRE
ncbi:hypothetical protein HKX17_16830 [Sulfitobacter sp. KE34]|uniref:polysaccharide biosynthesis/export family protein n=1 Tax=unclassified Sulfitobacter TaxID=196795 RepID=UPI0023E30258|nr:MULTISPECIES: polysaccharide biosynthesis/export family protein [unclassified Sulfitobacter]MDF3351813.1 hypothetical protein [Sulfitobacter sp. KE12]MDF3355485.1 hypothetical protein [Sulfitobacter sp. KE27]MDF3359133.1 hypothetical protein [Sulfitobacter sp. KE33]MDF3366557.1 hypothetical protein [Sulfitobacter sp. Ks34]MDF3370166.1 hypothetical protein [Sulfitobacter sp. Ks43]